MRLESNQDLATTRQVRPRSTQEVCVGQSAIAQDPVQFRRLERPPLRTPTRRPVADRGGKHARLRKACKECWCNETQLLVVTIAMSSVVRSVLHRDPASSCCACSACRPLDRLPKHVIESAYDRSTTRRESHADLQRTKARAVKRASP